MALSCRYMCHILVSKLEYFKTVTFAFKLVWNFLQEGNTTKYDESSHDTTYSTDYDNKLECIPKQWVVLIVKCIL